MLLKAASYINSNIGREQKQLQRKQKRKEKQLYGFFKRQTVDVYKERCGHG